MCQLGLLNYIFQNLCNLSPSLSPSIHVSGEGKAQGRLLGEVKDRGQWRFCSPHTWLLMCLQLLCLPRSSLTSLTLGQVCVFTSVPKVPKAEATRCFSLSLRGSSSCLQVSTCPQSPPLYIHLLFLTGLWMSTSSIRCRGENLYRDFLSYCHSCIK